MAVINTGWKGGIIRHLEVKLGRPLQWVICLLHLNELPTRHLFQHLFGSTTGPSSYAGPIGKKLVGSEELPVTQVQEINCKLPEVPLEDHSTDQIYLLEISQALNSSFCTEYLARCFPGNLFHARWLTTNHVLHLYMATEDPSLQLQQLVEFILKSYIPC